MCSDSFGEQNLELPFFSSGKDEATILTGSHWWWRWCTTALMTPANQHCHLARYCEGCDKALKTPRFFLQGITLNFLKPEWTERRNNGKKKIRKFRIRIKLKIPPCPKEIKTDFQSTKDSAEKNQPKLVGREWFKRRGIIQQQQMAILICCHMREKQNVSTQTVTKSCQTSLISFLHSKSDLFILSICFPYFKKLFIQTKIFHFIPWLLNFLKSL